MDTVFLNESDCLKYFAEICFLFTPISFALMLFRMEIKLHYFQPPVSDTVNKMLQLHEF